MPFDRVHQLAVLAILAPHVDRNDGVQGRNHEKGATMWGHARRRTMPGLSGAAPILLTCGMTDLRTAFDHPAAAMTARARRFLHLRPCASAPRSLR